MHCAPYVTGNYTRYMEKAFSTSLKNWTKPYERPTILYHNDYDGKVVGRVVNAYISESAQSKSPCLFLEATAPDWNFQQDLINHIHTTTSIGVEGTDVRCSICGAKISEGEYCEHHRGKKYDGQICTWDVYKCIPREISYVIVPSDKMSKVVDIITPDQDSPVPKRLRNSEAQIDPIRENQQEYISTYNNSNHNLLEGKNTMPNDIELKLKESQATIDSLEAEKKAWTGEKISMTEQITALNNEKVAFQEQIQQMKSDMEGKDAALNQEKELKEAAEKKVEELMKEVKASLVESLATLRIKANKPALEKLEERSIDSLRDSIADLKAEMDAAKLVESKGAAEATHAEEPKMVPENQAEPAPEQSSETYAL